MVVAAKGGAPTNPDWYHNLLANPAATVELGTETFAVRAAVPDAAERDRRFARIVERMPGFGDYQQQTTRRIPVVVSERVAPNGRS